MVQVVSSLVRGEKDGDFKVAGRQKTENGFILANQTLHGKRGGLSSGWPMKGRRITFLK